MKSKFLLTLICGLSFLLVKSQVAPVFTGGISQTLSVCQNSGINVIDSKMVTSDPDPSQTLTYTISSAPIHGTVHGFPGLTSTGAGGIISPSGFDYAPANGYNGKDSFVVNVFDGSFNAQTKIVVTVNALPSVATITGTAAACIGSTSQLAIATVGGVWSSNNVFVADISNTGLVTAQAAGTATISYTVSNGTTGCNNTATLSFLVGGYPVVQPITGTTTVCAGSTTQLSSTTSGGVWTSNNTTRATVNSSTGLVTGVSGGNVTITYTVTNGAGCSNAVTTNVTVNNKPTVNNINASTTTICVGSTVTLTNTTNGGVWSSNNTTVATVNSANGIVTGVAIGTATISYTVTNGNGCTSAVSVDITVATAPNVAPITGPTRFCLGTSVILSNPTTGGVWSVTPINRATITQTGFLTGNTAGVATITYTVTGGSGCSKSVTYSDTIVNAPNLGAISGSNQICVGTTSTLTNSTGGGTWSSTNTSIATVTNGGVVTGVAAGNDTIVYIVTNNSGCSDTVRFALTVTSSISVNAIQGGSSVCMGSNLILTNTTPGGTWNSSDLSIAAVVNGTVYPIIPGVVAITYTVGSGACTAVATKNVIVYSSPSVGAITGNTAICVGTTSQLSNSTSDGVWSSSNVNVASISTTGLVTPANLNFSQNATITYTVTNSSGCTASATAIVTVNPRPTVQPITGTNSTCVGSTTALSVSNPTGGIWTSSDNAIAIVSPQTPNNNAVVIGMSAGIDTITYTVTNGNGCATAVKSVVTISPTLVVAPIVGNSTVCIGVNPNPTYTCTTTGGTWSSNNTSALNINATSGAATGVATGTATVSYTVNKGGTCVASSTLNVVVANRPGVPTVSGPASVCVDASITLTGSPAGGYWLSQQTNFLTIDSTTGVATGVGSIPIAINVTYTVSNAAGCSRTSNNYGVTVNAGPNIGQIQPNTVTLCVGQSTTLTNNTSGGKWESSNYAIATIDAVNGVATGVSNGNVIIRYIVTNGSGCASVAQRFVTVNTTPNPGTLSGQSNVCVGSTTTFVPTVTAGSWSSSNTSVATVSNTGAVTGVGIGTCNISYTVSSGGPNGCTASAVKSITVNAVPSVSPITTSPLGQTGLCVNATMQLNNATVGGTWASSNTNRAIVNASGLVTGVSAGAIIITYTVSNGTCSATAFGNGTVYVLPNVAAINGASSVCVGSAITLSNDTTGGVWSSENNGVATVDVNGVVTGIAAGVVNINYSKTNSSGCVKTVVKSITVNSLPTINSITNNNPLCVGTTNSLSNATIGGTWTSSNTTVATINTTGIVTGLSAGVSTIKYVVNNLSGCSDSVSVLVTVNALPLIGNIGGNNSVCIGSNTSVTNSTTGGTWSSSNSSIASISSGGVVSGLIAGTTFIKYQVTNVSGCTDSATTTFTVNALPIVASITGNSPVCVGSTRALANSTSGGVWSSNNTNIATVNASGNVLGVSAGNASIKYQVTNSNGCSDSAKATITVNALPTVAALTGINTVCVGLTTTYSSTTAGGVWSSSNTSIATVSGGIITGVAAGNATISYAVINNEGCTTTVSRTITVNALPTVASISGSSSVCLGSTINLTNTTTGGIWTSNNLSVATINSSTGLLTALSSGSTTITYTVSNSNGCINSVTKMITVNANPIAAFSINNAVQCISGNAFSFTNSSSTPSGTIVSQSWSFGEGVIQNTTNANHSYTSAGTFNVKLVITNSNGCKDSVTNTVNVKDNTISTTNTSICPSALPFTWNGLTFTVAGSQTAHLTNSVGCDSAATLNLTVKANTISTTNTSICPSALPYTWNGLTFTVAGSQTAHLTNSVGCDSAATLNLTVKANTISTTNTSICPSALPYSWNGLTFTVAGIQTAHLTNSVGCDSAATLNLTVKANTTSTTNTSICPSALPYSWNGLTFTVAGSQTAHLINSVGCDSAATLNLTVKANTTSTINTSICPSELPYSWNGLTFTGAGSQTYHTTNSVGCDSAAILNLTVKANTTSTTNTSICPSELPYSWNGLTFIGAGSQTYHTTNSVGCDSAATLNLTVKANSTSTTNTSICPSDLPYTWNGLTFTVAGTQTAHLTNSVGCDSAATLNLTVKANTTSITNTSICPSALPYTWNGLTFTVAGTQTAHLTNSVGCDSAATLNLTVKANTTSTTNTSICPSALPYTWNGLTFTVAGSQTAHLTNSVGCDSAATLNLTVKANTTSTTNISICPSALPYTWNGLTFTGAGSQTYHTTNSVGCDSAATLNLTVKANTTSTTNTSICPSELPYSWNGLTFTGAGSQTYHTTNSVGCDSAATLNLTVKANTTSTTNTSICPSDLPYTWNGLTFTGAGSQTYHTTNSLGCDSAATLNLFVKSTSTSTTLHTACDSYTWNGNIYNTSGSYVYHTTNSVGCDSAATLVLTINNSTTSSTTHTACDSYMWNGTTYNASGSYVYHTTNSVGCDSAATLILTINNSTTSSTTHTACDSYIWNGTTYNASGSYVYHTTNSVGCDSAATLVLTINKSTTSITTHTACDSYLWNGTTYNTSGSYVYHTTNSVGCDSAATLVLTINNSTTSSTTHTACDSYMWNGTTYNASGSYVYHTTNSVGCDSAATLVLTVNYSSVSTTTKTICASELPFTWNGLTFTVAGTQTAHLTNSVGCDSAATLNLTVNANPVVANINGTKSVCVNGTTSLSNNTPAGVWSSSNTNIATINNLGVVSGLVSGTTSISYTVTNSNNCSTAATTVVTVNSLPTIASIVGSNQVCVGNSNSFTNDTLGGVWSSLTPMIATVTNGGIVTGVSVGGTTIKYTVTNATTGCTNSVSQVITVNGLPSVSPITGTTSVCVGATTSLTSTTTGGVWSSNNNSIANIDNAGNISGIGSGVAIISYSITNSTTGCTNSTSTSVTVNALPALGGINGSYALCVGSSTTLSNTTSNGTWTSSDVAVATISNLGLVNALSAGTTSIKYFVTNASGCMDSTTKSITVNENPIVTAITAAPSVCVGSTITASNTITGGVWSIGNNTIATVNTSGVVNGLTSGVTFIKYTVTDLLTTCSSSIASTLTVNTPAVAPITGVNALCTSSTSNLSTTTAGGVWSSSDPSVASVNATTGLVTAITNGTTVITYKVPVGNACGDSASTTVTVNPTLIVLPITGDSSVCAGSTSTLSSLTIGGTWSSSNTAVATIDANSGMVTALSDGTSIITYNVTSGAGCADSVTTTFTVNALPASPNFTVPTSLCVGSTIPLNPTLINGIWSSSPSNVVNIDNAGNATGITSGMVNVSYFVTNLSGCNSDTITKILTVTDLPFVVAIAGNNTVCLGSTITLTNDSTGGTWNSSNSTVLTIDAFGVVTPVSAGTTNVTYTITNAGGCSIMTNKSITVFGLPTVAPITGANSVCLGADITLSSTTSNGVWSSLTPTIASISNGGVLTGNASGGTTISYTVTDAATTCTNSSSQVVTVNALPIVSAITGSNSVCLHSSILLSSSTSGGTWSSSNTSIATVDNTGLVDGVSAGTATITYSVTNGSGCFASVTTDVTVNVQTVSSTSHTACNSYMWNGTTYTTSGTYTYNTTNSVGCDSIATLILTINNATSSSTAHTACNSYMWNGTTYTTSGTYNYNTTNSVGCDSVATLILTINNATSSSTSHKACNSYMWNGTTYTTSGTYTFNTTNSVGCDSVATLVLTINNATSSSTSHTACNSYMWNGTTYTTSGTYTFNTTNSVGCDSIATLILTINNATASSTSHTACNSYMWNGTTYTTSGTYTFNTTNSVGCDSVATLVLTITNATTSTNSLTICDSELPYSWNGLTFATAGTQTATLTNAAGCDSLATLNLTVNQTPATPTITVSTTSVVGGQTGVVYTCTTVANATSYQWSYSGTGATISGNGTNSITIDFDASATGGDLTVVAVNGSSCTSAPESVTITITPVPVVLSSFSAEKLNNTALVKWTTVTEINSKNFEIQRSIDGRNFVTIGVVNAKGNSSSVNNYSFIDEKPFVGINYYRLKQVDNDGKFATSNIKSVKFDNDGKFIVNIYPNPVSEILNVRVSNGDAKQINIINTIGRVVYTTSTISTSGTTQLPVSNLSAGTYFVEIISNDNRIVEKFIKN